ncbi:ABC transporter ATP-binding protein/permease [Limibaculum sp. FT325]|uniref:ABC transporter ATP-binding protein n=1 Tax=Thermohalobaculum sediminis TaxID=2939436 RepID=UPI0020BDAB8E|nr:ABC transporter ATP-binding protein [Limibaculum sediminis]MCL5777440.1 ABC transporter ATP-binding protein/permease [Limibaculum sediminis]
MPQSAVGVLVKRDSWSLIYRLMKENAADKWQNYATGFALLMVVSGATALSAYIMRDVINEIFVDRREDMVIYIALAVTIIFGVKGAAAYGSSIILARAGNAIVARLQRRLFDAILSQDLAYYQSSQLGNVLIRFQNGVQGARAAIETLVLSIGRDVFSLIGLVAVMVVQDPFMSLLSLVIGPPAVLGVMHLMRQVKKVAQSEFASLGRIMGLVKETFLGVKVVKSFRLEGYLTGEMDSAVAAVERLQNRMARINSLTIPLMETLGGLAIATVILYGGSSVISGRSDPGALFSFITALLLAYEPARRLARFNVQFQQSMIGVTMVYEILDRAEGETEREDGPALGLTEGRIDFDSVVFSYGSAPALNSLNISFPAKKVTALVGPSGGGKSTIIALITRLWNPTSGRILIDGTDIRHVSARSLRESVSLVTQDSFLFEGSIRENLRMGNLAATDEQIVAAAKAAHAHGFILEQPNGYDTEVGEGGSRLSGGQRQRIAIARAMLADAPILLLDEATSALDSVSESKVQAALEQLMEGRTTVVIAHRLSTIRNASMIHVIDQGRCVESGAHDDLLNKAGLYAHLYQVQFSVQS